MTGRLDFVLQFRDAQVAEDVRKKAELGWFDMEFTMYGVAYLHGEEMCYKVSAEADKIYSFMDEASAEHIYCSNVLTHTRKTAVPIGMKEEIALALKKELACRLQREYPRELFVLLQELADDVRTDGAYPWLGQVQEAMEGLFDERCLRHFADLVKHCYSCQVLGEEHYRALLAWIHREYQCMLDSFVSKDIFEKKFYGIAYAAPGGGYHYLFDSLLAYMGGRRFALEEKGMFVSPVFAETLWHNYTYGLTEVRADYEKLFHAFMNAEALNALQAIVNAPKRAAYAWDDRALWGMGECARASFNRYMGHWGINRRLT